MCNTHYIKLNSKSHKHPDSAQLLEPARQRRQVDHELRGFLEFFRGDDQEFSLLLAGHQDSGPVKKPRMQANKPKQPANGDQQAEQLAPPALGQPSREIVDLPPELVQALDAADGADVAIRAADDQS